MHDGRRNAVQIIAERLRRPGFRARVDAKCIDCTYDEAAPGSWRAQVDACAVTTCPLWPVRPRSSARPGAEGDEDDDERGDGEAGTVA
jgi:hypothetical protein